MLAKNVASFCKCNPVIIGGLRSEWVPQKKQRSSRLSFGELDHGVIGTNLARFGFISRKAKWSALTVEARNQILEEKGLGGQAGFVEVPIHRRTKLS